MIEDAGFDMNGNQKKQGNYVSPKKNTEINTLEKIVEENVNT